MGLYFLNSVLLKCFVIGVNGNILVLVFAVEDWHLYLRVCCSCLAATIFRFWTSYKAELSYKSKKCVIFTSENGLRWMLKLQIKGRSCPGNLSQAGVPHGTSCRLCQSGGCRRTAGPARRLSCYPAASLSTSTHSLRRTHTGLCNRCWSEERSTISSNQCG